MAPTKAAVPPYSKDERVLCFHHDMLYEAKVLDSRPTENGGSWQYKIHYKGWKNTWDDWVPQDRVRKFTDENKELANQLMAQFKALNRRLPGKAAPKKGAKANGSEFSSARGSEERHSAVAQTGRGPRRTRDYDLEQEDAFHARPSIKLVMPDQLKAILVDDWENITKNQQLVPLPAEYSVNRILYEYYEIEKNKREEGTAERDILDEFIAGLREYFDRCIGRILLYRFERYQYLEARNRWTEGAGEYAERAAGDTYGAEHLCRLFVSLPELIAQTNMDQQSVNRLREELSKITNWLARHTAKYFAAEYESPGVDYIEKARST